MCILYVYFVHSLLVRYPRRHKIRPTILGVIENNYAFLTNADRIKIKKS
jgi:hypothetical protein